jgi:sec-independent protein translocase protein TatB
VFGVSFTELLLIGAVTLMIVGPERLPKMLGTLGRWSAKLRRLTTEVRYQSGIDDLLRKEGITGGLNELRELRNVARGDFRGLTKQSRPRPRSAPPPKSPAGATNGTATPSQPAAGAGAATPADPFANVPYDRTQEYPTEGCDAYGAMPDDLWHDPEKADAPIESAPTDKGGVAKPTSTADVAPAPPPGVTQEADSKSPTESGPAKPAPSADEA